MHEQFITVPLSADLHGLALHFDCGSSKNINAFLKSQKSLDPDYGKTFILLPPYYFLFQNNLTLGLKVCKC